MNIVDLPPAGLQLAPAGMPQPEASSPLRGSSSYATAFDHKHPRVSQAYDGTLGANGEDTVVFATPYAKRPAPLFSYTEQADNGVVSIKAKTWNQDANGNYTSVTIKGYRSRKLPTQQPVTGLLTAVITGVNALVSLLTDYDIFAGVASGVTYHATFIPLTSNT